MKPIIILLLTTLFFACSNEQDKLNQPTDKDSTGALAKATSYTEKNDNPDTIIYPDSLKTLFHKFMWAYEMGYIKIDDERYYDDIIDSIAIIDIKDDSLSMAIVDKYDFSYELTGIHKLDYGLTGIELFEWGYWNNLYKYSYLFIFDSLGNFINQVEFGYIQIAGGMWRAGTGCEIINKRYIKTNIYNHNNDEEEESDTIKGQLYSEILPNGKTESLLTYNDKSIDSLKAAFKLDEETLLPTNWTELSHIDTTYQNITLIQFDYLPGNNGYYGLLLTKEINYKCSESVLVCFNDTTPTDTMYFWGGCATMMPQNVLHFEINQDSTISATKRYVEIGYEEDELPEQEGYFPDTTWVYRLNNNGKLIQTEKIY